jgi:type VI protein secretion system component Hcp
MKKFLLLAMLLLGINLAKSYSQAAPGVYLFCSTITNGGSTAAGHSNEVETLTKLEGVTLPVTIGPGGLSAGTPSLADFVIDKNFDVSSMRFRNRLIRRQALPSDLEIRYYNGTSNTPVYVIILQNCFITSITNNNADCTNGCPGISESYSFTAGIISWRNNATTPAQIITFNRITGQVTSSGL